jgi:hypothetical protein
MHTVLAQVKPAAGHDDAGDEHNHRHDPKHESIVPGIDPGAESATAAAKIKQEGKKGASRYLRVKFDSVSTARSAM